MRTRDDVLLVPREGDPLPTPGTGYPLEFVVKSTADAVTEDQTSTEPARQSPVKVIRAAVVGTVVEYYDFGIYGYMATIVASLFFASGETPALKSPPMSA
mgnify:CR=1 FL=1